ncbi:hypothetical protein ACJ41O_000820 [Fusarium nematophilum]
MANNYTDTQIHTGAGGRVQLGNTYMYTSNSQEVNVDDLIKDLTITEAAEDLRRTMRRGRWTKGTCEWVLQRLEFQDWLADGGDLQPQPLWLVGPPGSGKTVISCFIVGYFKSLASSAGFAYYFCDDKDELRRTGASVLRGILVQLLKANRNLFDHVKEDYKRRRENLTKTVDSLWSMLVPVAKHWGGPVFIVIDALDECEESSRSDLLDLINTLDASIDLRILITSRPETFTGEVDSAMIDIRLNSDEINHDLAMFINQKITTIGRKYSPKTVETIKETVLERSGGTFLWAALILNHITEARTSKGALKKLQSMPITLQGLYGEILEGIQHEDKDDAAQVLRWVAASRRPMTRSELATAMLLCSAEWDDSSDTAPLEEDVEDLKDLYKSCGQLLYLDETSQTVNLIHQSAKDYLSTLGPSSEYYIDGDRAGMEIITTCWKYLRLDFVNLDFDHLDFVDYRRGIESRFNLRLERVKPSWVNNKLNWARPKYLGPSRRHRFLPYAAEEVFDSAGEENIERVGAFVEEWQDLGQLPPVRDYWLTILAQCGDADRVRILCEKGAPAGGPASSFERGGWEAADQREGEGYAVLPLHGAARMGHERVCGILIRNGADVNALDEYGESALFWAARHDRRDIAALLLREGAKLGSGITLVEEALRHETEETALCLMESEACLRIDKDKLNLSHYWRDWGDRRSETDMLNTALATAVRKGFYASAKRLLEAGANPVTRVAKGVRRSHQPLSIAMEAGQLEVASLLIDFGAGVGVIPADLDGRSCYLQRAIERDDISMIKLLIDRGADIEATECWSDYSSGRLPESPLTALCIASEYGNLRAAEVLIEEGAKFGSGALHLAALNGHEQMVGFLLDKGEDVGRRHDFWHSMTPLHVAAQGNRCKTMELLLARGAMLEDRDERGWTPLHCAVLAPDKSAASFLLKHGADITVRTDKNETALHLIAQRHVFRYVSPDEEALNMARLLVREGLSVNNVDCHGRTALHYVADESYKATAEFLIDQGADVNATDPDGCSPLHLACTNYSPNEQMSGPPDMSYDSHQLEMYRLLLERGADYRARDSTGRTVLFKAAASRERFACDLLLRRGLEASEMCSHVERLDYPDLDRLEELQEAWRLSVLPSPPLEEYRDMPSETERMLMDALFEMAAYFLARDNPSAKWLRDAVKQRYNIVLSMLRTVGEDVITNNDLRWVLTDICKEGDLSGLKEILRSHADVLSTEDMQQHALRTAIALGRDSIFWYLFGLRAEWYTRDSPSFDESLYGQLFIMLLEWGHPMHAVDDSEDEHSDTYDMEDLTTAVRTFLDLGGDVEGPGSESFLIEAVRAKNVHVAEILLARGADISATAVDGATVMQCALSTRNEHVIFLLLKHGADFDGSVTAAEILSYRLPRHLEDVSALVVKRLLRSLPDDYRFEDYDAERLVSLAHSTADDYKDMLDNMWRLMDPYQRARIFGRTTFAN